MSSNSRQSYPARDELIGDAVDIRDQLRQGLPRTSLNILVFGQPGAGKSSLINSLITAIDKQGYREIALRGYSEGGAAGAAAVTTGLEMYPMFEFAPETDEAKEFKCKPVFWDFAGLQDSNETDTLIKLLKGTAPDGISLTEMKTWSYSFKDWWKYLAPVDKRVHLILFVHPADQPSSDQLLKTVREVVLSMNDVTYKTTVMVVITKKDKIYDDENMTKEEKLEKRSKDVAAQLKLENICERNFVVSGYTKETAQVDRKIRRNHDIDQDMCDIWEAIVNPYYYKQFSRKE